MRPCIWALVLFVIVFEIDPFVVIEVNDLLVTLTLSPYDTADNLFRHTYLLVGRRCCLKNHQMQPQNTRPRSPGHRHSGLSGACTGLTC